MYVCGKDIEQLALPHQEKKNFSSKVEVEGYPTAAYVPPQLITISFALG